MVDLGAAYYDFEAEIRTKEEIKEQYEDDDVHDKLKVKPAAREESEKPNYLESARERIKSGEKFVVRVKMPTTGSAKWKDMILRKEVEIKYSEVPDLILLKSDGFPTYHLAVVVDDTHMNITHLLRGFEWISTTPIHLFLFLALGYKIPIIGHFPVILDPRTGKKFSKRDMEGMFGVRTWFQNGYLKEAILNYLMLLGWAPKDNREFYTLDEFTQAFNKEGIQKANPTFDAKKMDWFNGQYIRKLDITELEKRFNEWYEEFGKEFDKEAKYENVKKSHDISAFLKLVQERAINFKEILQELFLLDGLTSITPLSEVKGLSDKSQEEAKKALNYLKENLVLDSQENWQTLIRDLAKQFGWKDADMFMLLRLSVWGKPFSPPLYEIMCLLGEDECKKRIVDFT